MLWSPFVASDARDRCHSKYLQAAEAQESALARPASIAHRAHHATMRRPVGQHHPAGRYLFAQGQGRASRVSMTTNVFAKVQMGAPTARVHHSFLQDVVAPESVADSKSASPQPKCLMELAQLLQDSELAGLVR